MSAIAKTRAKHRSAAACWSVAIAVWVILLLFAFVGDRTWAIWVHANGIDEAIRGKWFALLLKFPGTFWFVLLVCILGFVGGALRRSEAIFILLAGIMSGINWLLKWFIGRMRPFRLAGPNPPYPYRFQPFLNGLSGLVHQKNLSFPSGHSCTAFALATAMALVRPGWKWLFLALAIVVGVERVFENAHYLSDVVCGAGVGAGGALLVRWAMKRRLDGKLEMDS